MEKMRNNLLPYYSGALKKAALSKVIESLSPGGYLIVGSHEKLPGKFSCPGVEPTPYHRNIYLCREKEKSIPGHSPGGQGMTGQIDSFPKLGVIHRKTHDPPYVIPLCFWQNRV